MSKRPPPPPPAKKPGKVTVYRGLYQYESQHPDELSFDEGDLIYVTEEGNDGWWKAIINGKEGIIPGNYVSAEGAETVEYPLHEAAKRGNVELLAECLTNRVSVNGLDKAGSTPLHWAARGGHIECVARLLAADNVEVNAQNKMGDTALHGAAWKGETQVTTMLLEKGAHTNIKNNDGDIPYDLASKSVETQALLRSNQSLAQENEYGDSEDED